MATWSDISGSGTHATQGTAARQPTRQSDAADRINGLPVVRFDGSDGLDVTSGLGAGGPFTRFAVHYNPAPGTTSTFQRLFSAMPTGTFNSASPPPARTYNDYNLPGWSFFPPYTTVGSTGGVGTPATAPVFAKVTPGATATGANFRIGGLSQSNNSAYKGDLAELLGYAADLSGAQEFTIETPLRVLSACRFPLREHRAAWNRGASGCSVMSVAAGKPGLKTAAETVFEDADGHGIRAKQEPVESGLKKTTQAFRHSLVEHSLLLSIVIFHKMQKLDIPRKTVYRLSLYYRALQRLRSTKTETVSSAALAKAAGVKPTQLRKDLTYFGQFGTRGLGYSVDALRTKLTDVLGTTHLQPVILVGAGHLGSALLGYHGFAKEGFEVVAAFDLNASKFRAKELGVKLLPMTKLGDFIRESRIKMAILTVPGTVAQEVANELVAAGILAILNFAPIILQVPDKVVVNNVDLAIELENLSYFIQ